MKKSYLATLILTLFVMAFATMQAENSKQVKIQTNLHCEGCKTKIEKKLQGANGVIKSTADVKTKVVTVNYNPDKTTIDNIRQSIADMGYKADFIGNDKTSSKECKDKSKCSGKESCCGKGATKK